MVVVFFREGVIECLDRVYVFRVEFRLWLIGCVFSWFLDIVVVLELLGVVLVIFF